MTDIAPDIPWSRFNKRKRRSPTRDEHPRDQPPATEPSNEYERKPRHRTRKDRYEYKTTGSPNKNPSNADKRKTNRQRRSRKQTINDVFHASNVARNRLTVRTDLGVLPSLSEPFFSYPMPQSWESSTRAEHRPPSSLAMVSHHTLQVCLMGATNSISKFPTSLCPKQTSYRGREQGTRWDLQPPSISQASRRKQTVSRDCPSTMMRNGTLTAREQWLLTEACPLRHLHGLRVTGQWHRSIPSWRINCLTFYRLA